MEFGAALCTGLCINHRPDHIRSHEHIAQLADYLARLGLNNARHCILKYHVTPADQIAEELERTSSSGADPGDEMDRPGAVIHWRIQQRAKELGLWKDPRDAHRDPAEIAARPPARRRRP